MKNIFKRLLIALLAFGFMYLLGAFSQCSLDISKWTEGARGFTSIIGGFAFFGLLCTPFDFNE